MAGEIVLVIITGSVIGSFGSNIISHFISGSKLDLYRSKCFCGKKTLRVLELIPLISYLYQKGRCTFCGNHIPGRYLFIELGSACIALFTYLTTGSTSEMIIKFSLYFVLFIVAVIDYYRFIIPDILLIILAPVIILNFLLVTGNILSSLLFSAVLTLILFSTGFFLSKYLRKQSLGMGDIKLLFLLSLIVGFPLSALALWIAALIGILYAVFVSGISKVNLSRLKLPFGTFLCLSFSIVHHFDQTFIKIFTSIFIKI
ncbi:MAG: prepilin peptidase [Melioribacteraceae bacterium]|nr:prepilin peptidase [Melioribacteraceae bacterium]MCF8395087.1 prepilin peptidase [Melioribacteraceae bacterium]MCF8420366.1 prepilin peptidase [Melioribacteraceae bacterium]